MGPLIPGAEHRTKGFPLKCQLLNMSNFPRSDFLKSYFLKACKNTFKIPKECLRTKEIPAVRPALTTAVKLSPSSGQVWVFTLAGGETGS